MANNKGTVIQVMGPVLDIRFGDDQLPQLLNAIEIPNGDNTIVAEVAQHIGDNVVRCIAMSSTDGLQRGTEATDTGAAISVPVGDACLGAQKYLKSLYFWVHLRIVRACYTLRLLQLLLLKHSLKSSIIRIRLHHVVPSTSGSSTGSASGVFALKSRDQLPLIQEEIKICFEALMSWTVTFTLKKR